MLDFGFWQCGHLRGGDATLPLSPYLGSDADFCAVAADKKMKRLVCLGALAEHQKSNALRVLKTETNTTGLELTSDLRSSFGDQIGHNIRDCKGVMTWLMKLQIERCK
jgi:hypothetical protein